MKFLPRLGVSPDWKSRAAYVKLLRKDNEWPLDSLASYITRGDTNNKLNIPNDELTAIGARLTRKAWVSLLERENWASLSKAIAYNSVGVRIDFYWHYKFRELGLNVAQPLRMMSHLSACTDMANAFLGGQYQQAIYFGYLTHALLNRSYQLVIPYEEYRNRGYAFMLRLFAEWREFSGHMFPAWAFDEPIYEGLLQSWRAIATDEIKPWLLAACDRHTYQSKNSTEKNFYDFSGLGHMPLEILTVLRLRQSLDLENPVLDHPLMASPFDRLPEPIAPYEPDDLMLGCLKRAGEDWPDFDEATSLETLRAAAIAPTAS